MKISLLTAALIATMATTGLAGAQTALKPEEIIAARQAGMALTGSITEAMKAGIAAGAEPKTFEAGAAAIAKWGAAYPHLFPEGTQTGAGTKAKKEIWSDRAGFDKASADMVAASIKLADAAKSNDKAAFAAAFTAEGQSCGGCHRNYKER